VTESWDTFREMRALAAELLRAQRHSDRVAFDAAMLRAEGRVPALLISLCGLSNNAMNEVIGKDQADALIERLSQELPPPVLTQEESADVWRDAAALIETVARGDLEAARALTVNTPNLPLLQGFVLHVLAAVLDSLPAEVVDGLVAGMRESEPPV
jgi:DNA-binding GntR family transcriptional regulator